MSWIEHHKVSENHAAQAQTALRQGQREIALKLYAHAAEAEEKAIAELDQSKRRTIGISSVSAVSLYYKAGLFSRAEKVAYRWLGFETLPDFSKDQLRNMLQSIWSEEARVDSEKQFEPGEVVISVQGGNIVTGGAPLDLIMEKMNTVKSLFHRTAEFLGGHEHRRRGGPSQEIQKACSPWLFQTTPGSYQFAVAIQGDYQLDFFNPTIPSPRNLADYFLDILRAGIENPEEGLEKIVPNYDYRNTFMKLTRNLAPDGKTCDRLNVQPAGESTAIILDAEVRKKLRQTILKVKQKRETQNTRSESLHGMLRAVHLDKDWLELTMDNKHIRVEGVGEEVDDTIGPLVNKPVIVHSAAVPGGKHRFLDIELDSQA